MFCKLALATIIAAGELFLPQEPSATVTAQAVIRAGASFQLSGAI